VNIIYKTIKTPTGYFVYDRSRDSILAISESEYNELESISNNEKTPNKSEVISKYQKNGYLLENTLEHIEHPYTNTLEHYLNHHMEQLILQVTQRCNLRCSYCVYSGNYDNRVHTDLDMDLPIALKAIDMYMNSSEEVDTLRIAFYGGEPLLMFKLIQQCVEYVKSKSKGRAIDFFITTNAVLLSGNVAKYLYENNFHITISIDGPKSEHDRYRKFSNGMGSFDTIMKNIRQIKMDIPGLFNNLAFNIVANPEHNYGELVNFFEHDALISKVPVTLALVEPKDPHKTIEDGFSDEFRLIRMFDYFKLLLHMIGKLDNNNVSKFTSAGRILKRYEQIRKLSTIGKYAHHSGPCIPGGRRAFVNVSGCLYPCERVSETSFEKSINDCDSVLFLSGLPETQIQLYHDNISYAIHMGKQILFSRKLNDLLTKANYNYSGSKVLSTNNENATKPVSDDNLINNQLKTINIPIIGVMGLGDYCGKYSCELALREHFKEYKILQYSSKDIGGLFGIPELPDFIYDRQVPLSERVLNLNDFIYQQCVNKQPNLLLIGFPEAIVSASTKILNDFGEIAYIISQAVLNIDLGIMCVYFGEKISADYLNEYAYIQG
jgi:uncharacterized protein